MKGLHQIKITITITITIYAIFIVNTPTFNIGVQVIQSKGYNQVYNI